MENEKVDEKGLASRVEELEKVLTGIQGLLKGEWRMTEIEKQAMDEIERALAQPSGNTPGKD